MEEDDWLLELGRLKSPLSGLWRALGHVHGFFPVLHVLSSRHRFAACVSTCDINI